MQEFLSIKVLQSRVFITCRYVSSASDLWKCWGFFLLLYETKVHLWSADVTWRRPCCTGSVDRCSWAVAALVSERASSPLRSCRGACQGLVPGRPDRHWHTRWLDCHSHTRWADCHWHTCWADCHTRWLLRCHLKWQRLEPDVPSSVSGAGLFGQVGFWSTNSIVRCTFSSHRTAPTKRFKATFFDYWRCTYKLGNFTQ